VDDSYQDALRELGLAINDAVTGSDEVNAALEKIRERGIEVFLVLEATICIRRPDGDEPDNLDAEEPVPLDITSEDERFLRRLRISVDRPEHE